MTLRLGKLAPRHDPRTLKLATYLPHELPPIPPRVDWRDKMGTLSMWGNDQYGDCVFAALANCIQAWCCNSGRPFTLTQEQVLAAYSGCTGFDPNDPSTDNGTVILDALRYMQHVGLGGYKIGPYMSIDPRNDEHRRAATYLYGAVLIGVNLPASASGQFEARQPWTLIGSERYGDTRPGSWGGHGVMDAADFDGELQIATWSRWHPMEDDFADKYCDEMFAIFSPDWLDQLGENPLHMHKEQLQADLRAL